jgi:hypothetical protein
MEVLIEQAFIKELVKLVIANEMPLRIVECEAFKNFTKLSYGSKWAFISSPPVRPVQGFGPEPMSTPKNNKLKKTIPICR